MKKILFLIIFCVILLTSCAEVTLENVCPYAVMIDDITYYYTEKLWEDTSEKNFDILGKITSSVPENQMPQKNGEANLDILESPYAKYNDGMIVKIDNEWIFFEKR